VSTRLIVEFMLSPDLVSLSDCTSPVPLREREQERRATLAGCYPSDDHDGGWWQVCFDGVKKGLNVGGGSWLLVAGCWLVREGSATTPAPNGRIGATSATEPATSYQQPATKNDYWENRRKDLIRTQRKRRRRRRLRRIALESCDSRISWCRLLLIQAACRITHPAHREIQVFDFK